MSAIEDKIRRKVNEQAVLCQEEVEILLQTQRELTQGKNKLDTMFENLEREKVTTLLILKKREKKNSSPLETLVL